MGSFTELAFDTLIEYRTAYRTSRGIIMALFCNRCGLVCPICFPDSVWLFINGYACKHGNKLVSPLHRTKFEADAKTSMLLQLVYEEFEQIMLLLGFILILQEVTDQRECLGPHVW